MFSDYTSSSIATYRGRQEAAKTGIVERRATDNIPERIVESKNVSEVSKSALLQADTLLSILHSGSETNYSQI